MTVLWTKDPQFVEGKKEERVEKTKICWVSKGVAQSAT